MKPKSKRNPIKFQEKVKAICKFGSSSKEMNRLYDSVDATVLLK